MPPVTPYKALVQITPSPPVWAPSCSSKGVCRGFQRLRDERSSWYFFQCLCAWRRSVYDICCAISTWITCSLCRSARRCEGRSCKTDSCAFLRGYIIRFTSAYSCCWEAFQRILQYSHRGGGCTSSCRRKNSKMKSYRSSANERREERFTTMSAASLRHGPGVKAAARYIYLCPRSSNHTCSYMFYCDSWADVRAWKARRQRKALESRNEFRSCASCSPSESGKWEYYS